MKKVIKKIEELREEIEWKKESLLIPREIEVEYIKALVELLKIETILIIEKSKKND